MINTVIFDLSEVQITGLIGVENSLYPLLKMGKSKILSKLAGSDMLAFFSGSITEDEYINRVISKNKWPIESNTLKMLIRKNFKEIKGTREILERLKNRGYKLGLLSVHGKEWIDYISQKFDHHKLFHSTAYSFESGISKPDKRAYLEILKKLGSKPDESIFIDDNLANLVPAKELGMKTILFTEPKSLEKELKAEGITF